MPFADREEAGRRLAEELRALRGSGAVVLAVAPGGVPVGAALAAALDLSLEAIVVRDVPAPRPEAAPIGAVAEVGEPVFEWVAVERLDVGRSYLVAETSQQQAAARRDASHLRRSRPLAPLQGRTAIVVDQVATDAFRLLAAARAARALGAGRVVAAVPVATPVALGELEQADEVDEVVSLEAPPPGQPFGSLHDWYAVAPHVSEREVVEILAAQRRGGVLA